MSLSELELQSEANSRVSSRSGLGWGLEMGGGVSRLWYWGPEGLPRHIKEILSPRLTSTPSSFSNS